VQVIEFTANPHMYGRLSDDMDIEVGRIISEGASVERIGGEILDFVACVAAGERTGSEELGHAGVILSHNSFEPIGPACLPV